MIFDKVFVPLRDPTGAVARTESTLRRLLRDETDEDFINGAVAFVGNLV
jgi:hypothetical protein